MRIRIFLFLSMVLAHGVLHAATKVSTGISIADPSQRVISENIEQTIKVNFTYPYTAGQSRISYVFSENLNHISGEKEFLLDFDQSPSEFSTELSVIATQGSHYLTIYIELQDSASDAVMLEVVSLPIQAGEVTANKQAIGKSSVQGVLLQKSQSGEPEMVIMPAEETIIAH